MLFRTRRLHDLRYGLRVLRQTRFSAVTILSLALEIGASAAIFSSADALAPPAPVPHASGLLTLRSQLRREGNAMFSLAELSHPDYEDLRIRSQSFAGLAATQLLGFRLCGGRKALCRR